MLTNRITQCKWSKAELHAHLAIWVVRGLRLGVDSSTKEGCLPGLNFIFLFKLELHVVLVFVHSSTGGWREQRAVGNLQANVDQLSMNTTGMMEGWGWKYSKLTHPSQALPSHGELTHPSQSLASHGELTHPSQYLPSHGELTHPLNPYHPMVSWHTLSILTIPWWADTPLSIPTIPWWVDTPLSIPTIPWWVDTPLSILTIPWWVDTPLSIPTIPVNNCTVKQHVVY